MVPPQGWIEAPPALKEISLRRRMELPQGGREAPHPLWKGRESLREEQGLPQSLREDRGAIQSGHGYSSPPQGAGLQRAPAAP